jgi:hypothetical protein
MTDYKFTHEGLTFRAKIRHDNGMSEPWKEHDGHGIVSEWTSRDKRAGERVLIADRGSKRYYDFAGSVAIALMDGWGGEGRTKREKAADAVERDYKHLKAWCDDEWYWVYVAVELLDVNGDVVPGYRESLGGMESTDEDGIRDTAVELAGEIAARVGTAGAVSLQAR